ncbi:hypothetical protein [Paraburkholderia sp. RL17-381-BIF-C]|uniref:hypothetical protein n=1 Tax=Paraburkholderia sp. RL17-381-BIF-C TaxID=3031635 RepID=UPI0038B6FB83
MPNVLEEYRAALERLKEGRPNLVPKGTRITNDAVALEAGRNKGSIKKSRSVFSSLIHEIDAARAAQVQPADKSTVAVKVARSDARHFRKLWNEALEREVSLLIELMEARKKIASLTGEKIFPIRRRSAKNMSPHE